ncbi:hypothetical protein [Micromonospora sp. NPDC005806]|uniref:hypothetical protein n=1 Tax=Micromonospora sp. NPDC005806 TaxID=3364234 RepID=UPI003692FE34
MNQDRLRLDLADLAEEVTPVDLRDRALRTSRRLGIQRAVTTSAAVIVMLGAATGTAFAFMPRNEGQAPMPADTPSVTVTASSSGEPSPSPTASGSPTATPSDTAAPSDKPVLVLGPDGFGALKLGMSKKKAEVTGMISDFANPNPQVSTGCPARAEFKGDGDTAVWWSTRLGVAAIVPPTDIKTAEGIGVGSSRASVVDAYPTWRGIDGTPHNDEGRGLVPVPGNPDAVYRIEVQNGKVRSITLQLAHQDCYE